MSRKILIIGGVALGPKVACRCRRLDATADITVIDENALISYGGCGIPYYMSGEINTVDALRETPYKTIRDAQFFAAMKDVTVRTQTRALSIDRVKKTVLVRDLQSGNEESLAYDTLVLATGARPRSLPVDGADLQGVYAVTKLEAAAAIRKQCEAGNVSQAVIIGGGFIGLECGVALADMWGVECSVIEMQPQLLPGVLSPTVARMAQHDFESHGVTVYTDEKVVRLEGDAGGQVARVVTDKRVLEAQLVICATGFIPNSQLAKDAGLEVTAFGGIVVNQRMQTSDSDIYAGGDCVALPNIITGSLGYMPLGSMANRQGRVIGTNVAGGEAHFKGYVGTWAVKLFDMSFSGTGLTIEKAKQAHFDAVSAAVEQLDRAHFYPEKHMMSLELVVDKSTRRVLGAQGACVAGDALKARIDAIAGVLQCAQPTVEDISNLEVSYAPPFAAAMDVVNTVGNVADNVLSGWYHTVTPLEFFDLWNKRAYNDVFFVDARPLAVSGPITEQCPDWHGIPLEQIKERAQEIPHDRPVAMICNSGLRAYDALVKLQQRGVKKIFNSNGGMQAATKMGLSPLKKD